MMRRMEGNLNMLILTRKPGETVAIGRSITLKIFQAGGKHIRIGIDAPKEISIRAERTDEARDSKVESYASTARMT
jgi:carbon storage regulator